MWYENRMFINALIRYVENSVGTPIRETTTSSTVKCASPDESVCKTKRDTEASRNRKPNSIRSQKIESAQYSV